MRLTLLESYKLVVNAYRDACASGRTRAAAEAFRAMQKALRGMDVKTKMKARAWTIIRHKV